MSANNTPRSDAVLKNLPKDRQHEIWLRRTEGKEAERSLDAIRDWLKQDGLRVSRRAVSEFLEWYSARQDLQTTGELLETFEEFTRKQNPGWSADKVRDVAVQFFMAHTVASKNVNQFVSVGMLDQGERHGRTKAEFKERELRLKEEKSAEEKKDAQTKALELCLEDAAQFPAVQELFKAAFTALRKAKLK